jgi:uncharacterized membrane protein
MSVYELALTVHVLAAVVWVGSNVSANILGARRLAGADADTYVSEARHLEWYGNHVLVPVTLLLLASGIAIVVDVDGYGFGDLWIALGLAGYAFSFVLGAGVVGPQLKRFHEEVGAAGGGLTATSQGRIDRIVLLARIEVVVLLLVVVDMVLKPGG